MTKFTLTPQQSSPFLYVNHSITTRRLLVIILLGFQITLLVINKDTHALLNIGAAVLGTVLTDIIVRFISNQVRLLDYGSLMVGMLIGFLMPTTIGFMFVFFVAAFSYFVTVSIFGGLGSHWINPVAFAVCFAYVSRMYIFPPVMITLETLHSAGNPFTVLQMNNFLQVEIDRPLTSTFNAFFLHKIGVSLPEGYISLFLRFPSVIPAFRYNLLTLIASIILFATQSIDRIIPTVFLLSYSVLLWFFSPLIAGLEYKSADILVALLTSGILFIAFFVLPDSGSIPRTMYGKIAAGFIGGFAAFLFCGQGTSSIGGLFTVLTVNITAPAIEYAENIIQKKQRTAYEH